MTTTTEPTYFAVVDPDDPEKMTYWRRDNRGTLSPWPQRASYAPALYRSDLPRGLGGAARTEYVQDWYRTHRDPWWSAIRAAIDADPAAASARFAAWAMRCCCCGRTLTDAASKTYGIGPECRAELPAGLLTLLADEVGRLHASIT